jgi:hypothetical protein
MPRAARRDVAGPRVDRKQLLWRRPVRLEDRDDVTVRDRRRPEVLGEARQAESAGGELAEQGPAKSGPAACDETALLERDYERPSLRMSASRRNIVRRCYSGAPSSDVLSQFSGQRLFTASTWRDASLRNNSIKDWKGRAGTAVAQPC